MVQVQIKSSFTFLWCALGVIIKFGEISFLPKRWRELLICGCHRKSASNLIHQQIFNHQLDDNSLATFYTAASASSMKLSKKKFEFHQMRFGKFAFLLFASHRSLDCHISRYRNFSVGVMLRLEKESRWEPCWLRRLPNHCVIAIDLQLFDFSPPQTEGFFYYVNVV